MSKHLRKAVIAKLHALKHPDAAPGEHPTHPEAGPKGHVPGAPAPARVQNLHQHRGSSAK